MMSRRFAVGLGAVILSAFAVGGLFQLWLHLHPAPEVPQPPGFAQLEPQLREYLVEKIAWVRSRPRRADRHAMLGLIYSVNSLWREARLAFQNSIKLDRLDVRGHRFAGAGGPRLGFETIPGADRQVFVVPARLLPPWGRASGCRECRRSGVSVPQTVRACPK